MSELEHRWDLKALCKNDKDADKRLASALKRALSFEKKYKGKLASYIDKPEKVLNEYEEILEEIGRVMTYAFLCFASNSEYGGFYASLEMRANEVSEHLLFLDLEFCSFDEKAQNRMMKSTQKYAYYLEKLRDKKRHQLSLLEERVLLKTAPVGIDAFSRLFDEFFSKLKVKFKGEEKSEEEILALLHHPDREMRKKAQKKFSAKLDENQMLLTYIFNMVKKDLQITKELRGYEKPESFRHLSNHISQKSVDSLINVVNKNMTLVHRYYALKSEILGYELRDYDRYAPLFYKDRAGKKSKKDKKHALEDSKSSFYISYADGLKMVLACFKDFCGEFLDIAAKAIKNGWIDSHPRDGKRGGAFSHGAIPSSHPYVLLNHTGNRRDVFTIAHEFGHMIHQELSKIQGYLNHDTPLTTAETASVFAEMLLFDHLKTKLSQDELKEIYAAKLEDIFSTLFRQVVMTNFERRIHDSKEELKSEEFSQIWLEENAKMFGESLKLTQNYGLWWSYIPHFVHSPFYCYAYSYGQLLVLALFGLYKQCNDKQKDQFKKKYINFLSSGGSKSPRDLIKEFGFDVEDSKFWEIGMREVSAMLKEFEELL